MGDPIERLTRKRDQTIASLLQRKEQIADARLSAAEQAALRKAVLDAINSYHDTAVACLAEVRGSFVIHNELADLIRQVHGVVVGGE